MWEELPVYVFLFKTPGITSLVDMTSLILHGPTNQTSCCNDQRSSHSLVTFRDLGHIDGTKVHGMSRNAL